MAGDLVQADVTIPRAEQKHSLIRRAFAPAFTKRALAAQEPLLVSHVNAMVEHVVEHHTQSLNAVDLFLHLAFNSFSDLFLGDSLNLFDDAQFVPWAHSGPAFNRGTAIVVALSRYALVRNILKVPIHLFGSRLQDSFLKIAYERIDRRLAIQTDRPDVVNFVLGPDGANKGKLALAEIRKFAPFLLLAGTDTTPVTLSGLTFLLLKHPDALDRVTREIRTAFKTGCDITLSGTASFEYLNACIEETLRIYPPLAPGMARVVPTAGASIAGRWVPGGTIVHQTHGATFNASYNFRDPDAFIPERWLPDQMEAFSTDKKNSFHPFGVGPSACFGVE